MSYGPAAASCVFGAQVWSVFSQLSCKNPIAQDVASEHLPRIFVVFAVLGTLCVIASIVVSMVFAPEHDPMFHFGEEGLNTALSATSLSMASAVSAMVFYLRLKDWSPGAVFWLVLAAGCLFLSLDEQLGFHERGGMALDVSRFGELKAFRNWNDIIVIFYGLIAIAIAAVFGREILHSRHFAGLFAVSFTFYAAHTAIDSILPSSIDWKDIPEEGTKLMSVFLLFLASCARFVLLIDGRSGGEALSMSTMGGDGVRPQTDRPILGLAPQRSTRAP